MATRIRYYEISEGILKSTQTFLTASGDTLTAHVFKNGSYALYKVGATEPAFSGDTGSIISAKKAVKEALVSLGVNFQPEVRTREKKNETANSN